MMKIYGIHDQGGESLKPSWVVQSFSVLDTPSWDFRNLRERGILPIARLNWSHSGGGTLPEPSRTADFISRCVSFVQNSVGCDHWIIANEPNHPVEKPVTPATYAAVYNTAYLALKQVAPQCNISPAAIAPWTVFQGIDWIAYFKQVLGAIENRLQFISLHSYSRGYEVKSVTDNSRMDSPYAQYYKGFRSYQDFLEAVPLELRHLPVHITEANGNGPWPNRNNGYVQKLFAEVDRWNQRRGTQKIHSLSLFRWQSFDTAWEFETKPEVHADYRAAVAQGYEPPREETMNRSYLPIISTPSVPSPRQWDERLTQRGVAVETPPLAPGEAYWKVVKGEWLNEAESKGRHHLYFDVWNSAGERVNGVPIAVTWPSGATQVAIDKPLNEPFGGNFPMSPSRNEYTAKPVTELPAERVIGLGMGSDEGSGFNAANHTSTVLVWQLSQAERVENPVKKDEPYVVASAPSGINLRYSPSLSSPIIQAVPYSTVLPVTGKTASDHPWYRVDWNGQTAWVYSSVVKGYNLGQVETVESETPALPAAPSSAILNPLSLLAFLQVESGNSPFMGGLLTIRFEVHIFKRELNNDSLFAKHFRFVPGNYSEQYWRPSENEPWRNAHGLMNERHELLRFARSLNDTAALRSTGMGLGQVMGSNFQRVGFASPQVMFKLMSDPHFGANAQLIAFINYILSDSRLEDAIQRRDWFTAVQLYNGIGQEAYYSSMLTGALNKLDNLIR